MKLLACISASTNTSSTSASSGGSTTVDGRNLATHKYVKTWNWSETSQIASDVDKNWCRLRLVSRRFLIWHSRRNLSHVA
jgi:hypothetical protein